MIAGNQAFQKQANLALVLRLIREHGLISRVELSRQLGLKKSTVTNIINQLLELEIVETRKEGESTQSGGRKPVFLGINPRIGHVLGLELETGYFRAILCDISGNEIWTRVEEISPGALEDLFFRVMDLLQEDIQKAGAPLIAIGVGIAGMVDLDSGVVVSSTALKLDNYDFVENISNKLDIPVFFENDTNCCAWGELWRKNSPSSHFLYLLTRFHFHNLKATDMPGVGLGMVINGQVYYGADYRAGEFGSNRWEIPGTEYLDMSREELLQIGTNQELMITFMTKLFQKISVSLSLFNPEEIILGGDIQYYKGLLPQVMENLEGDSWFGQERERSKIHFTRSGDMEIPFGAAALVLERLYSIPQLGKMEQKVQISWDDVFARQQQ